MRPLDIRFREDARRSSVSGSATFHASSNSKTAESMSLFVVITICESFKLARLIFNFSSL